MKPVNTFYGMFSDQLYSVHTLTYKLLNFYNTPTYSYSA